MSDRQARKKKQEKLKLRETDAAVSQARAQQYYSNGIFGGVFNSAKAKEPSKRELINLGELVKGKDGRYRPKETR